jgi:hypothetical protein
MVISEYEEVPRQWSMACWIKSRGSMSADSAIGEMRQAIKAVKKTFIDFPWLIEGVRVYI